MYAGATVVMLGLLASRGLYGRDEQRADHTTVDDLPAIFNAVTTGAFLFFAVLVLAGASSPEIAAAGWASLSSRFRYTLHRPDNRPKAAEYVQNTVIVGGGEMAQLMARKLLSHPEYGLRLVGLIDDNPRPLDDDVDEVPVLGGPADTGESSATTRSSARSSLSPAAAMTTSSS